MISLLTACQSNLVRSVDTVPVPVVTVEKCLKADAVPAVPVTKFSKGMLPKQQAAAAEVDLIELEQYAARADVLLRSCAE